MNVLLLGSFGFRNIGDELICRYSLKWIKENLNPKRIYIVSFDPTITQKILQDVLDNSVVILPLSRLALSKLILSFRINTVVIGGGQLFQKKMTRRFAIYILLSRLLGKKTYVLSIGIDKNLGFLEKVLLYMCIKVLTFVWARDRFSYMLSKSLNKNTIYDKDIVDKFWDFPNFSNKKANMVIITRYSKNIKKTIEMINMIEKILSKQNFEKVYFIPFSENPISWKDNDLTLFRILEKRIRNVILIKIDWEEPLKGVYKILEILGSAKFVITNRLHGYIISKKYSENVLVIKTYDKLRFYI